ncbi:MAG: CerR family C-terminal domain-containing protein [Thermodesulfobacteriota bacterium]
MTAAEGEGKSTREKIMDVAAEVFGRRGFKAATIREICRRADVNVASVNYYFQGKEGLYREVARNLIATTFARYPVSVEAESGNPPEQRLRTFVSAVFHRLLAPGGLSGYPGKGQLVARELADPSPILDSIVEDFIRPTARDLSGIIMLLLGPAASERDVIKCQISVIGQCFHYALARPILTRLTRLELSDEDILDELAEHVTRFSLAGIAGIREEIGIRIKPTRIKREKTKKGRK